MFLPLFLLLLVAVHRLPDASARGQSQPAGPRSTRGTVQAAGDPSPRPGQPSSLSIYTGPDEATIQRGLEIGVKLDRGLSNLQERILVTGIVEEDVVSGSGNIIIPAGSKVAGVGYCDAARTRVVARGKWTFYVSDHQISLQGSLWGADRREGLSGLEDERGADPTKVKQAIYRDGVYLYVPEETEFTLRLNGNISVRDLGTAFGK
jgi:hypothetical protein